MKWVTREGLKIVALLITAMLASAEALSQAPCVASASSLTPVGWRSPVAPATATPKTGLKLVRELPLPGPANRFDYQSVDVASGRIYMKHMNAGRTIVFDANAGKVLAEVAD